MLDFQKFIEEEILNRGNFYKEFFDYFGTAGRIEIIASWYKGLLKDEKKKNQILQEIHNFAKNQKAVQLLEIYSNFYDVKPEELLKYLFYSFLKETVENIENEKDETVKKTVKSYLGDRLEKVKKLVEKEV